MPDFPASEPFRSAGEFQLHPQPLDAATSGYNGRGLPHSLKINGSPDTYLVSSVLYNSLALPTELNLGNNTKTTYGYWDLGGQYDNPGNYYAKLWEIKTVKVGANTLQDVKHTWDATGNLTQRENVLDVEKETFGYDFLDRLTSQSNFLFKFGDVPPNTVNQPWHATVDTDNTSWVADFGNARVAKFNPDGSYGNLSFGSGYLSSPTGVTRDSSGNFYVSDYWNHRVYKFDPNGNHILNWGGYGTADDQFRYPSDVVFNPVNGYIYVLELWGQQVKYFTTEGQDPNGADPNKWGSFGTANGQFRYPYGLGVDTSGNIYVADTSNNRVQKFTATGTWLATWGGLGAGSGPGQFSQPKDVAVDSSGNVFVADSGNNRLQKLNPSGSFITAWSGASPVQYPFSDPRGVALSASRIYAVDTGNSRLQTFDSQTTAGWAYNQIGNMTLNDGKSYTYGSKPHAVTAAGSSNYVYDGNGNMTSRNSQTLTWDVENRLIKIDGVPTYVYDGNGFRVKKTEGGVTTLYINKYYEKRLSDGTVTLYYYLGDKMVAFKEGTPLRYIHRDHLTSTSVVTDASGTIVSTIKYKAYGEARGALPDSPAQKFTGQRLDIAAGLYYYNARYYDAGLGRFISADSIVPGFSIPQSLNRYTYVLNNPLKFNDPSGHMPPFLLNIIKVALIRGDLSKVNASIAIMLLNPTNLWTAFHEIAQVNIARELYRSGYGPVELEYPIQDTAFRADVVAQEKFVWEVKAKGRDAEPQLNNYVRYGHLLRGTFLKGSISDIPVVEDIKMMITFGDPGEAHYSFYRLGPRGEKLDVEPTEVYYRAASKVVGAELAFGAGLALGALVGRLKGRPRILPRVADALEALGAGLAAAAAAFGIPPDPGSRFPDVA